MEENRDRIDHQSFDMEDLDPALQYGEVLDYFQCPIVHISSGENSFSPINLSARMLREHYALWMKVSSRIHSILSDIERRRPVGNGCPAIRRIDLDGDDYDGDHDDRTGPERVLDLVILPSSRRRGFYVILYGFPGAVASAGSLVGWCDLTPREADVAVRVACGCTLEGIASELGISVGTVRNHLKAAYQKIGLRRQSELAARLLPLLFFSAFAMSHRNAYPRS